MSDSVRPHRRQPARLPRPWDSPGKNEHWSELLLKDGRISVLFCFYLKILLTYWFTMLNSVV